MKVTSIKESVSTDFTTGEVHSRSQEIIYSLPPEESFVKCYLEDLGWFNQLSKSCPEVLFHLLKRMDYSNKVSVFIDDKQELATLVNGTVKLIEKCVQELYQKGLLIRYARGKFIVNPKYFGKGSWADIKRIRSEVIYSEEGRFLVHEFISETAKAA